MIGLSADLRTTNSERRIPHLIFYWSIFSLLIAIILVRDLLFSPGLPYTRDLIFPYDLGTFSHALGTWNSAHSQFNPEINKIPLYLVLLAVSSIIGSELTVKLLFMTVVF